jgi:polar amino acid transport system ATP-binding protein
MKSFAADSGPMFQNVLENEAVRVENLHKSFGALEVLKGVSLSASKGDVVAIIGGSGSGKSTFLRCVNFLETPCAGRIVIGGEEVVMTAAGAPANRKQIERIRTRLGMVFQSFNLWTHRTLIENIMEVPVYVLGMSRKEALTRAEALLSRVGLADKADTYPAFLSGGSSNAPPLPVHSRLIPMSCFLTNPPARLIRNSWVTCCR